MIETGKIVIMVIFLVLGAVFGSTIGYNFGHASGVFETNVKLAQEALDTQVKAVDQTASTYANIPSNPVANVETNPFDDYYTRD